MDSLWGRFESWLKIHFKDAFEDLNDPATDTQIQKLEATISTKLPEDFVQFLKVHNGQGNNSGWIIDGSELLSIERIIDEWGIWNGILSSGDFDGMSAERGSGVKSDWWNPKWIPFTYDGGGNHLCIDLDPAATGNPGQIITMWHDSEEREIKAISFRKWFEQYVNEVEAGKYVYSADYEAIVSSNDI